MAQQVSTLAWLRQAPSLRYGQAEPGLAGAGRTPSVGVDIPLIQDTPVGAPLAGTVLYTGYHGWGGQIDIQSMLGGVPVVEELIHMDTINVTPGETVGVGSLLGLSGGQLAGGNAPNSPRYSTGPHIKYSLFSGTSWGNPLASLNPAPVLAAVAANATNSKNAASGGSGSQPITMQQIQQLLTPQRLASQATQAGQWVWQTAQNPGGLVTGIFQQGMQGSGPLGAISGPLQDIGLGLLGGALILVGILVFFFAGRNGSGGTHAQTVTRTVAPVAGAAASAG